MANIIGLYESINHYNKPYIGYYFVLSYKNGHTPGGGGYLTPSATVDDEAITILLERLDGVVGPVIFESIYDPQGSLPGSLPNRHLSPANSAELKRRLVPELERRGLEATFEF